MSGLCFVPVNGEVTSRRENLAATGFGGGVVGGAVERNVVFTGIGIQSYACTMHVTATEQRFPFAPSVYVQLILI